MNDENEEILIPLPATLRQVWEVILSPEDLEKALGYASDPDMSHDNANTFQYAETVDGSFIWRGTEEGQQYWQERFCRIEGGEETDEGRFLRCRRAPGHISLDPGNATQPFTREDPTVNASSIGPGPHSISIGDPQETLIVRTARVTRLLPSSFFASFPDIESSSSRIAKEILERPGQSAGTIAEALCASGNINTSFLKTRISWDLMEENPNTIKYRIGGGYDWAKLTLGDAKLNPYTGRMEGQVHPKFVHLAGMLLGCPVRVEE